MDTFKNQSREMFTSNLYPEVKFLRVPPPSKRDKPIYVPRVNREIRAYSPNWVDFPPRKVRIENTNIFIYIPVYNYNDPKCVGLFMDEKGTKNNLVAEQSVLFKSFHEIERLIQKHQEVVLVSLEDKRIHWEVIENGKTSKVYLDIGDVEVSIVDFSPDNGVHYVEDNIFVRKSPVKSLKFKENESYSKLLFAEEQGKLLKVYKLSSLRNKWEAYVNSLISVTAQYRKDFLEFITTIYGKLFQEYEHDREILGNEKEFFRFLTDFTTNKDPILRTRNLFEMMSEIHRTYISHTPLISSDFSDFANGDITKLYDLEFTKKINEYYRKTHGKSLFEMAKERTISL
jgi:hypothetical protein